MPQQVPIAVCVGVALAAAGLPAKAAVELKAGNPERKRILAVLRGPVARDLKQPVIFKVDRLKMQGNWAFLVGVPRQPNGRPIDYRKTRYQDARENGAFDDWICALLRKQGGQWKTVRYAIGATDVVYEGWDREYHAPPGIFK